MQNKPKKRRRQGYHNPAHLVDLATTGELEARFVKYGPGFEETTLAQTRVQLGTLWIVPQVFQSRTLMERPWEKDKHVNNLSAAIRQQGTIKPILVFAIAGKRYIVDGHCRCAAYWNAGLSASSKIPISYVKDLPADREAAFAKAVTASIAENSKDSLAFSQYEKREGAWRLVRLNERSDRDSVRDIAAASGVPRSTVGRMVKLLKDDPSAELRKKTWRDIARERFRRDMPDNNQDERCARYMKMAGKAFGEIPAKDTVVFCKALNERFPELDAKPRSVASKDDDDTEVVTDF